jgi:hypothetical protein
MVGRDMALDISLTVQYGRLFVVSPEPKGDSRGATTRYQTVRSKTKGDEIARQIGNQ